MEEPNKLKILKGHCKERWNVFWRNKLYSATLNQHQMDW